MIAYILYTLFIISCFILILVVLLQPGKGDASSALGGGVSGAAFGPRGATTLLAKITIGAGAAFMLIALTLGLPMLSGSRSVLQSEIAPVATPTPSPVQQPSPAAPAASPAASQ